MSGPVKKREIEQKSENINENEKDMSTSENEDSENDKINEQGLEIQVDFEGRNPQDSDYDGIRTLLQQLFLKAHINLGALAKFIISQNYIGSVVKQSDDDEAVDDNDDDDNDINDVFGITTVINISNGQKSFCIQRLRLLLIQLAKEHATDATNAIIKSALENDSAPLGFLLNERFVNIPAKISVPLLENLNHEIKRATDRKMPFNFAYYILICKLYKSTEQRTSKNKKKSEELEILWSNPEEEIFAEEADYSFEFSVENDSDSGLSGNWTERDNEMTPFRRVVLFEASKFDTIIHKIKNYLS